MAEGEVKGYLQITVIEASGKNKDENYIWDSSSFEGFVKAELRGGARNIKASSKKAPVAGTAVLWNEQLLLEVLEGSNELRVMLCKERPPAETGGKRSTSVIAACGIYVSDILDAVPIDKYFELFKPGGGGEGGFVRLALDYVTDPAQLRKPATVNGASGIGATLQGKQKRRALWLLPLLLVAGAAGAYFGKKAYDEQQQKKKK